MNDLEIVMLFWERNERAIDETQKKYGKYCYSVASNILGNREDAEECVNDTYIGAWNSIPPHRPECLAAFLAKITRRLSLKRLRGRAAAKRGGGEVTLVLEELDNCLPYGETVDGRMDAEMLASALNRFLASLDDTQRRVFVCRYWYFDTVADIAKRYGFGQSKVKMMLMRTRERLRKYLESEGIYL